KGSFVLSFAQAAAARTLELGTPRDADRDRDTPRDPRMIRFWCECGRQLQATEQHVGQAAVCPLCERTTTVPATDQSRPGAWQDGYAALDRGRYGVATDVATARVEAPASEPEPSSGTATAAAVCGLLSFPFMLGVLTGLPALVLGAAALLDRRVRDGE